MSKEAFAVALAGLESLAESANGSIRPVDRIHALGAAQRVETYAEYRDAARMSLLASLGVDLIRYTRVRVEYAYYPCVKGLGQMLGYRRYNLRLPLETRLSVAQQALREVREPRCEVCAGRIDETELHSVPDSPDHKAGDGPTPMVKCLACRGTGVRLWRDSERGAGTPKAYSVAHEIISEAIYEADRMGERLVNNW